MELTVVTPRFGGATRTGSLTFGQEYMASAFIAHMALYRNEGATSESLGWNVTAEITSPPQMKFDVAIEALSAVTAAHEGLRTLLELGGNRGRQVAFDQVIWGYEQKAGATRADLDEPELDLRPNDSPWALAVLSEGKQVLDIRFVGHHALFDAFSAHMVKERLEQAFDEGISFAPTSTGSSLDYAEEQRSASWQSRRERAELYFKSAGDHVRTGTRLRRSMCQVTTDTRVLFVSASRLRRAAATLGVSAAAALHAASARAVSQELDYPILLHEIACSNRTRRQTRELLTNLAQFTPLRAGSTTGADSELASARDMHRLHLQAMAHGEYDPRLRIDHLRDWEPDADSYGLPTFLFNHVPLSSHSLAPGPHIQVQDVSASENAGAFAAAYTTEEQDTVIVKLGIIDASETAIQTRVLASMHDTVEKFLSVLVSGGHGADAPVAEFHHDRA